jgi:hypothetical protein
MYNVLLCSPPFSPITPSIPQSNPDATKEKPKKSASTLTSTMKLSTTWGTSQVRLTFKDTGAIRNSKGVRESGVLDGK